MSSFRVMTYNVHSCVGTDGKLEPQRVARVIARSSPDLVAVQELDVGLERTGGVNQPAWLAEQLGMFVHFSAARPCSDGQYGNAIFSRHPFSVLAERELPRRHGELRAVQWLRVSLERATIDIMNTHLSLHFRERLLQIDQLLSAEWRAQLDPAAKLVLCGDFNSTQFSPLYRRVRSDLIDVQREPGQRARATWPSRFPLFRIDRVFASRSLKVLASEVQRDALSMVASDHLPLLVEFAT